MPTPRRKTEKPVPSEGPDAGSEKLLDEGDTIEVSTSVSVKVRGQEWWAKAGVTGKVRKGELPLDAHDRINAAAEAMLQVQVSNIINA